MSTHTGPQHILVMETKYSTSHTIYLSILKDSQCTLELKTEQGYTKTSVSCIQPQVIIKTLINKARPAVRYY